MLPNHTIGIAISAHTHLLGDGFPVVHRCIQDNGIPGTAATELESADVVEYQVTLRQLVELELNDLGSVLGGPEICHFRDGVGGHVTFVVLVDEEFVGCGADHEFDFGVELRLSWGVEGGGNFRAGEEFALWGGRTCLSGHVSKSSSFDLSFMIWDLPCLQLAV